ncbi:peptidyl-tRNA hydrolase, partial [Vibrio xuii]
TLPDIYKERVLTLKDSRISKDGEITIKAQQFRTQEQNKEDALNRLADLIRSAMVVQKKRRETKPTRASKERRLKGKNIKSQTKSLRGRVKH